MNLRIIAIAVVSIFVSTAPLSAALITNGGFETGDNTGWTVTKAFGGTGSGPFPFSSSGSSTIAPVAGSYYQQFFENSGSLNGDGAMIEQVVSVNANTLYRLGFYLGTVFGSTEMTVTVVDDGGAGSNLLQSALATPATDGGWQQYTYDFTPTSSSVLIRFKETSASSTSKDPALDEVTLEVVPEPATLALLGLGGLAALRRRR